MRSVIFGAALVVLSGCATVSMVPGEATVGFDLNGAQSALHTASDAYCKEVADEGWAKPSNGFSNLASILMTGETGDDAAPQDYASSILADTADPDSIVSRVSADADRARTGLTGVTAEALVILNDPSIETRRKDVTSYERALVRAQRASRAFAVASEIASERGADVTDSEASIAAFNNEIDEARGVADRLAARYANLGEASA